MRCSLVQLCAKLTLDQITIFAIAITNNIFNTGWYVVQRQIKCDPSMICFKPFGKLSIIIVTSNRQMCYVTCQIN